MNLKSDYVTRINRVFSYIEENLDGDLSLAIIADLAHLSPFHFHRIFKMITEETLNGYVTRKRIEKAAADLVHRDLGVYEVGVQYGFTDSSSFTRTFKKFYGLSPTAFRKQNPHKFSKIRQLKSKNGQAYPDKEEYLAIIGKLKNWIVMNANIEIKEVAEKKIAHVSCIGSSNLASAFEKLIRWATPKGLMTADAKLLTVYYDSFKFTEAEKVRMSAGIVLHTTVEELGIVALSSIEKGRYIVGSFEIGVEDFEKSATGLYVWMNENGYKKADRNPFALYHNNFNEHPEKICIVDFYIPIE